MTISARNLIRLFPFNRTSGVKKQLAGGKYKNWNSKVTDEDIENHIGNRKWALVPHLNVDGICGCGSIDIDIPNHDPSESDWEWAKDQVRQVRKTAGNLKNILVEHTGGRGFHIWFFTLPMLSCQMTDSLKKLGTRAGLEGDIEVFPDVPEEDPEKLTRAIRIPEGKQHRYSNNDDPDAGRSFFVDENFEEMEVTDEVADEIWANRIDPGYNVELRLAMLLSYRKTHPKTDRDTGTEEIIPSESFEELFDQLRPCTQEIYKNKTSTIHVGAHKLNVSIGGELYRKGGTIEHVHEFYSVQPNYKRSKTERHAEAIFRGHYKPTSCPDLQSRIGCLITDCCGDSGICDYEAARIYRNNMNIWDGVKKKPSDSTKPNHINPDHISLSAKNESGGTNYDIDVERSDYHENDAAVIEIEKIIRGEEPKKAIYIGPKPNIREISQKLEDKGMNYLIICSNKDLSPEHICPGYKYFQDPDLGSVPQSVCKNCPLNINPGQDPEIRDYLITEPGPLFFNEENIMKLAEKFNTCGKNIKTSLVRSLQDEPIVVMMTESMLRNHLFLDSPIIEHLKSSVLGGIISHHLDVMNTGSAEKVFYESRIRKHLGFSGIETHLDIKEVIELGERIDEDIQDGEGSMYLYILKQDIGLFLNLEDKYKKGILRRSYDILYPQVKRYDYVGEGLVEYTGEIPPKYTSNLNLYDNVKRLIKGNRILETVDGIHHRPLSFLGVIEKIINAYDVVNISDYEINMIPFLEEGVIALPNNYKRFDDKALVIHARKKDAGVGDTWIGDVKDVSKGNGEGAIIYKEAIRRDSQHRIINCIEICGGDIPRGIDKWRREQFLIHASHLITIKEGKKYLIASLAIEYLGCVDWRCHDEVIAEQEIERKRYNNEKTKRYRAKKKLENSGGEK